MSKVFGFYGRNYYGESGYCVALGLSRNHPANTTGGPVDIVFSAAFKNDGGLGEPVLDVICIYKKKDKNEQELKDARDKLKDYAKSQLLPRMKKKMNSVNPVDTFKMEILDAEKSARKERRKS